MDGECSSETCAESIGDSSCLNNSLTIGLILGLYVTFVTKIGPKFMEKRPAFTFEYFKIIYNSIQLSFAVYITLQFFNFRFMDLMNFWSRNFTELTNSQQNTIQHIGYWILIFRICALSITCMLVLEKKQHQVTFIHILYNCLLTTELWLFMRLYLGGVSVPLFAQFVHSVVNLCVFFYYLIMAISTPDVIKTLLPTIVYVKFVEKLQLRLLMLQILTIMYNVIHASSAIWICVFWSILALCTFYIYTMRQSLIQKESDKKNTKLEDPCNIETNHFLNKFH